MAHGMVGDRFLVFPSFALKFERCETVRDDTLRDVTHAQRRAAFFIADKLCCCLMCHSSLGHFEVYAGRTRL